LDATHKSHGIAQVTRREIRIAHVHEPPEEHGPGNAEPQLGENPLSTFRFSESLSPVCHPNFLFPVRRRFIMLDVAEPQPPKTPDKAATTCEDNNQPSRVPCEGQEQNATTN
jgi:hypothetical protein